MKLSDLYDALYCGAMAARLAMDGDPGGVTRALGEAHGAASRAFPAGSPQAKALGLVLDAVAAPEVTS